MGKPGHMAGENLLIFHRKPSKNSERKVRDLPPPPGHTLAYLQMLPVPLSETRNGKQEPDTSLQYILPNNCTNPGPYTL